MLLKWILDLGKKKTTFLQYIKLLPANMLYIRLFISEC